MDQIKIGRFIAARRKERGITQAVLAEMLGISDRAVSKWETGRAMPDADKMLRLCEILDITVNELLSGEKINMENNNEKTEQLLLDAATEIQRKNKIIWTSMWVIMAVSIIALVAGTTVAAVMIPEGTLQNIVILAICIIFIIPCFYALKLEVSVGCYKCKNCGCEIIPTYKEALNAVHMGTTRYLKCPDCGKRTWCRKIINR